VLVLTDLSTLGTPQSDSIRTGVPNLGYMQGRIKGGATGAIAPGRPLLGAPRDEIDLLQIKYSIEKFRNSKAIQEYNSILYSYMLR